VEVALRALNEVLASEGVMAGATPSVAREEQPSQ